MRDLSAECGEGSEYGVFGTMESEWYSNRTALISRIL